MTRPSTGGQQVTEIAPTADCADIRAVFFDMWRQDHPNAPLQNIPGDYVTKSGENPSNVRGDRHAQIPRV